MDYPILGEDTEHVENIYHLARAGVGIEYGGVEGPALAALAMSDLVRRDESRYEPMAEELIGDLVIQSEAQDSTWSTKYENGLMAGYVALSAFNCRPSVRKLERLDTTSQAVTDAVVSDAYQDPDQFSLLSPFAHNVMQQAYIQSLVTLSERHVGDYSADITQALLMREALLSHEATLDPRGLMVELFGHTPAMIELYQEHINPEDLERLKNFHIAKLKAFADLGTNLDSGPLFEGLGLQALAELRGLLPDDKRVIKLVNRLARNEVLRNVWGKSFTANAELEKGRRQIVQASRYNLDNLVNAISAIGAYDRAAGYGGGMWPYHP